jgi:hypothetical protein
MILRETKGGTTTEANGMTRMIWRGMLAGLTLVGAAHADGRTRLALRHLPLAKVPASRSELEPVSFVQSPAPAPEASAKDLKPIPAEKPVTPPAASTDAPTLGARIESAPMMSGAGCAGGDCEPYYRNRPYGHPADKRRTIMDNRASEPSWYKYYRCTHYGYHPTNWAPWPEGWLSCRQPLPGDHPYDIKGTIPQSVFEDPKKKKDREKPDRLQDERPLDNRPKNLPGTEPKRPTGT